MTEGNQAPSSIILRLKHVRLRTGLSRSTIYQRIKDGEFPMQMSLGPRAVGWLAADIEAWIEKHVKQSRAQRGT